MYYSGFHASRIAFGVQVLWCSLCQVQTVEKTDDFLTVPGVESTEVRDNGYHVMFTKEPYLVVDELRKRAADQLLSVSVSAGELDDVFWEYSNK